MSFTSNLNARLAAITALASGLPTDPADASVVAGLIADLDLLIDAIKAKTDNLPTDPADQSVLAGLIGTPANTGGTATIAGILGNPDNVTVVNRIAAVDGKVDTIKTKTDMLPTVVYKQFVATANSTGSIPLFTVAGCVKVKLTAVCFAGLTSDDVGTITIMAGGTALIPTTTATDLDTGEVWFDATPTTTIETVANGELNFIIGDASDITLEIVNTVDSGSIGFKVEWEVLVSGGSVVAAV